MFPFIFSVQVSSEYSRFPLCCDDVHNLGSKLTCTLHLRPDTPECDLLYVYMLDEGAIYLPKVQAQVSNSSFAKLAYLTTHQQHTKHNIVHTLA